ncbi:FAD binding domain-containing protein [Amycolatopsis sp. cmx-11-12]|uniref:FAD binding domain-containing protein n=1 Tax=Amycolatopsis sp. cmx-11-12 TaxID=2785795 RepID=UPI0039170602
MRPFTYTRAETLEEAVHATRRDGSRVLAGGTTLVDLMRTDVMSPAHVVDIGRIAGLDRIEHDGPVLRFGALAKMADVAADPVVRDEYPVLAESLRRAASQQLRNMATIGGNLLQRTRCPYFRDGVSPCNKREPGSGCGAQTGPHREHAVFGGSDACIAVYPGDFGTALAAFDATVELVGVEGTRALPFSEVHTDVLDRPEVETTLRQGELITGVTIPVTPVLRRSAYIKVGDRAGYSFAIASAAVGLDIRDGVVVDARVALGGVAPRPWRSTAAEEALVGKPFSTDLAKEAGVAAFDGAEPRKDNLVKVALGKRVVEQACLTAYSRGEL